MKSEEEGYVMTKVVKRSGNEVTVEVRIWLDGTLQEMEGANQEATNEGRLLCDARSAGAV
jgi:hypothetical protein